MTSFMAIDEKVTSKLSSVLFERNPVCSSKEVPFVTGGLNISEWSLFQGMEGVEDMDLPR